MTHTKVVITIQCDTCQKEVEFTASNTRWTFYKLPDGWMSYQNGNHVQDEIHPFVEHYCSNECLKKSDQDEKKKAYKEYVESTVGEIVGSTMADISQAWSDIVKKSLPK